MTSLVSALAGEIPLYAAEQTTLSDTLDQVFTNVFPSVGTTTTNLSASVTFTDPAATFVTSKVTPSDFVYIKTGVDAGIYAIQSVDSETQLTLTSAIPFSALGVAYRVVSLFGVAPATATALFSLYQAVAALLAAAVSFNTLITTPVVVSGDPGAFARATLTTDLNARASAVTSRISAISGITLQVQDILANTDKLYDKRYVWIDARVNLESGLVVQQTTAVTNRIKAQTNNYNQLLKLLAVEGS
jgi:hypothetical protein